jgi:hypothetical protein
VVGRHPLAFVLRTPRLGFDASRSLFVRRESVLREAVDAGGVEEPSS